ncbi:hypothetical protein Y032_0226g2774 [Ancylostoma ceylanicum]|uniref:Uncharacterized protein n=1 Tax=Ancylostoma ceylanicum TaxID=53326 RepID=A0A016SHX9_9BILA|nr:hypothetical protein Y032_0226g2774 [Ancylostoma ceylanicum]
MQYAIVFFLRTHAVAVVPRADIQGEFKLHALVMAHWGSKSYPAKVILIGSKKLCDSKVRHVTASERGDDFEFGRPRKNTRSRRSSKASSTRSENEAIKRLYEEIIAKMDELESLMPALRTQFEVLSEMRELDRELHEVMQLTREVLKRLPPLEEHRSLGTSSTGALQFEF